MTTLLAKWELGVLLTQKQALILNGRSSDSYDVDKRISALRTFLDDQRDHGSPLALNNNLDAPTPGKTDEIPF